MAEQTKVFVLLINDEGSWVVRAVFRSLAGAKREARAIQGRMWSDDPPANRGVRWTFVRTGERGWATDGSELGWATGENASDEPCFMIDPQPIRE